MPPTDAPQRPEILHFWVRADLVIDGRVQPPSACAPKPQGTSLAAGTVTRFLLSAWVGGGSAEFSVGELDAEGIAEVWILLHPGDVSTLKFSSSFNMVAPKGQRNCHFASGPVLVSELVAMLREGPPVPPRGGRPCFAVSQRCVSMRDNFSKNAAILRFHNAGTDCAAVLSLPLRNSALLSLDRTNAAVYNLGQRLRAQIGHFAVSPLNAGPQYMEAFSYLQMQNCLVHYGLLGHVFDQFSSPVQLPWVMYDAYQAVHAAGIHPAALASLSDVDFVLRFGQPLVTGHTACSLTSIYCTDYTLDKEGVAFKLKETEDMARTFGCLSLQSQLGLGERWPGEPLRSYRPPPVSDPSSSQIGVDAPGSIAPCDDLLRCVAALQRAQADRREHELSNRVSYAVHCDDCENASLSILQKARGVRAIYEGLAAAGGKGAEPRPEALVDAMVAAAASSKVWTRLFAHLTRADHAAMAPALLRLGRMLSDGRWATAFAVVSAKGPAYTEACPNAPGALSGHGTVISRIRAGGGVFHGPMEGTTSLCQDPPVPQGVADGVRVRLEDGSISPFDLSEFATVFAQNVHQCVGISADSCIMGHIRADYGDAPQRCPFYVAAFYTGLSEGVRGSMGCVPLDTHPPPSFGAGANPVFGAPVLGLSMPSTMAVPITDDLLSDDLAERSCLLDDIHAQMQEACCPEAPQRVIEAIASFWQPVAPLRVGFEGAVPANRGSPLLLRRGFETTIRSLNTWAFDDPAHTELAVRVYGALADRFNELQARDPACDHVIAAAYGHYLSAALRFDIPMRPVGGEVVSLSTFRNLRQAVMDVGLTPLVGCPLKMAAISARARVESDAHFYMCDKGGGPSHAHRARLV
jgi:hypothetical protein